MRLDGVRWADERGMAEDGHRLQARLSELCTDNAPSRFDNACPSAPIKS